MSADRGMSVRQRWAAGWLQACCRARSLKVIEAVQGCFPLPPERPFIEGWDRCGLAGQVGRANSCVEWPAVAGITPRTNRCYGRPLGDKQVTRPARTTGGHE